MEDSVGKTKKKLGRSLDFAVILFTLALSLCVGLIGYITYYKGMIKSYKRYEVAALKLAVSDFDWNAVEKEIASQKEGDALKKLRARLDYVKSATNVTWLYMIEPLNENQVDNMKYICTGNTLDDYQGYAARGEKPVFLGKLTGTEFPPNIAKKYLDFYKNSKPGDYWFFPNNTEWGYVFSTSLIVRNSAGKPLGVMSVDINMTDIEATMRVFPIVVCAASILLGAIFVLILTLWLKRRVIRPLKDLQKSAFDFVSKASGDDVKSLWFDDPKITTQDEIQSLSNSLIDMAAETKRYMQKLLDETAERERISADLNVAAQIQNDMLPHIFPGFPERTDFDLFASMNPAKEVGGDFYDFFFVDPDHLALVIADVSGKGIPASLFMVISKTIIKNRALSGNIPSPAQVLHDANNQLCEGNEASLFVTVWLGILDLNTGIVTAANAGHELPAIRQANGAFEFYKDKHGFVLAGMENLNYEEYQFTLQKGATLFVYTDGVPEATNASQELFGMDRLLQALNIEPSATPKELLPIVRSQVDEFVGDAPQFDDLTMLALKYNGRD
ncbi:MAG: SpoIIE family protein phosphatase [Treponema sp.]|nr:SpoIIE family protein phosphatase [Treponema sp.]